MTHAARSLQRYEGRASRAACFISSKTQGVALIRSSLVSAFISQRSWYAVEAPSFRAKKCDHSWVIAEQLPFRDRD